MQTDIIKLFLIQKGQKDCIYEILKQKLPIDRTRKSGDKKLAIVLVGPLIFVYFFVFFCMCSMKCQILIHIYI